MREAQVTLGDRPGLVRTNAADPADVLHADGATDERTAPRQAVHADAKKKREHHGKFFWQGGRRQRDRADGGVQPAMLEEHAEIRAATEKLRVVAQKEKASAYEEFAAELILHARTEEEVLYPAAILAGDVIRARMTQK